MEDGSIGEAVVVRYLLGDLAEEELVQVEDRAFADPDYLKLIEAVEADLIDAYVRDQMQGHERKRFEDRFFASAERRRKVEFARAWARVADEAKAIPGEARAAATLETRGSWRDWFAFLRRPAPGFQFAMVAAAVILVGVISWQVVQTSKLRSRVGELEAERGRQQQREQTLQSSLDAERARAQDLNAQLQHGTPAGIASLTLLPGLLRGETVLPQLVVPQSAQLARLEIQLEPRDKYPQFRAELRSQRGDEILASNKLREQRSNGSRAVVLEIPASVLSSGDYELTLKGMNPGRQFEDVGYYRFSVRRQ